MSTSSSFRDFISFLATVRGDLANITAPPYFLAPSSIVEIPSCYAERPSLFTAASQEPSPEKRALCVLKWILASLSSQYYAGRDVKSGIKKPINALLGEVFLGEYSDEVSTVKLVTEQVSHHPPITAVYVSDDQHGIRCQGYTRPEMTFSGYINIKQTGHAILHVDKYNEDYLFVVPDVKVKGFLSGHLYPEITGTYHILSSSGYNSEVIFSGKGFFSGVKNSFKAKLYAQDDITQMPIYCVQGQWSDKFTVIDHQTQEELETFSSQEFPVTPITILDIDQQDPWESRKAWGNVAAALRRGDMHGTIAEKSIIEEAQRAMRKRDDNAKCWTPIFFDQHKGDFELFERLAVSTGLQLRPERTKGVWKYIHGSAESVQRPYRGGLTPLG